MKRSCYAMVIGLAALGTSASHADVIDPKPYKEFKPYAAATGGGILVNPKVLDTKVYLDLVTLAVVRQGGAIRVEGVVKHAGGGILAKPAAASGNWTLFRSNNGKWDRIAGANLTLAAAQKTTVGGTFDGKGGTWFKLEVRTNGSSKVDTLTKQAPKQQFVVQYRMPNWQM